MYVCLYDMYTYTYILSVFTNLRALRLDNTLLEEFPTFLGKLAKLKSLSAVQNRYVCMYVSIYDVYIHIHVMAH